jgi:hypothetical protein
MTFRKANITLITLISFTFVCLIAWLIIYYLVFPMPNILDLTPNSVLCYLDIYNSEKVLSDIQRSELVKHVAESPWWNSFKSTSLWNELNNELGSFQQLGIDQSIIFRLIGTHSIAGFKLDSDLSQPKINYILISELDILTRFVLSLGQIERFLSPSEYTIIKEKYNGKKITSIKSADQTYYYSFVGRAGIISNDESLIKKSLDIHKNIELGVSSMPAFRQIKSDLFLSDVSFFVNTAKLVESSKLLERYGFYPKNISVIKNSDMALGFVSHSLDEFRLNGVISYQKDSLKRLSESSDNLLFPSNCLALITHKSFNPQIIFKWLEKNVSSTFAVIGNGILPAIRESIAEAIIAPKNAESQVLPSFLLFMRVTNRTIAETAFYNLKNTLKLQDGNFDFIKTDYRNNKIYYSSYIPGVSFPIGIGYVFVKDDILLISTDEPSIKEFLDVLNGKAPSLTEQNQYKIAVPSNIGASDDIIFINLWEMAPIIEQLSRLYLFQGMITGKRSGDRVAGILADNAFIMRSWNYLGGAWNSEADKMNIKLILTRK